MTYCTALSACLHTTLPHGNTSELFPVHKTSAVYNPVHTTNTKTYFFLVISTEQHDVPSE